MALINQPGMYQGTPSLNPLPYVNIALQARARKQAREDALDKYFKALPDTINDKGVRDVEIPIINEGKNKIMEFGVKNREALRNPKIDNGASQLELQKMMRDVSSVARMSQNAAQNKLKAGKFFLEKNNQYALNSDNYLKDLALSELPVTDPNYKDLDLEKYAANRPFDELAFTKDIKTKIPYSEKVVRQADPTDPNYEIVTTLPVLDEKAKIKIVSDAADRFHNDPIFRKKIQTDLAGTGQIPDLITIAKQQFGVADPTEMTDEILAAAYTYSKLPIGKTKEKVQPSIAGKQKFAKELIGLRGEETRKNQASADRYIRGRQTTAQTQEISGNAFDETGGVKDIPLKSGGRISKGIVYNNDGTAYTGTIAAKKEWLPANVTLSLSSAKIPLPPIMNINVKDGVIQSIMTPNGEVSRQSMENLQKQFNKEPVKAPQPVFGKQEKTAPPPKNPQSKTKKGEADDL